MLCVEVRMMPVDTGGRSHTQEEKVLVGQTGTEEWVAGGIEEVGLCISQVKRKTILERKKIPLSSARPGLCPSQLQPPEHLGR